MSPAYMAEYKHHFPTPASCFDLFHIMKLAGGALVRPQQPAADSGPI